MIKKYLSALWAIICRLFGADNAQEIEKYGQTAVEIIETLKRVIDNPLLDFITELTNTKIDDKILNAARVIITEMNNSIEKLREASKKEKSVAYNQFASEIFQHITEFNYPESVANTVVQCEYMKRKHDIA